MELAHEVPPEGGDAAQSLLLAISNEMVRIYKEQFGRGPTKVRTDWAGPDAVLCTLRDSFTPAERNLAAMGELHRLRDTRMFFQYATKESHHFGRGAGRTQGNRVHQRGRRQDGRLGRALLLRSAGIAGCTPSG